MAYCPECKIGFNTDALACPVCGHSMRESSGTHRAEVGAEGTANTWVVVGCINDKISADFALETLRSFDIPAILISRAGFFGSAGLLLHPFYDPKAAMFEISVPFDRCEEAVEILDMTVKGSWYPKES